MRVVERPTQHNRRTGHGSIPLYIGTFRNNLQFSFCLFQKELALFVCDCDSLACSIRPAAYPPFVSSRKFQTPRGQCLPILFPFQIPPRSILQNSADHDHSDVSIEKASDRRRRYPVPQMGQTHLRRLPFLGSHQPATARLHLGTQLGSLAVVVELFGVPVALPFWVSLYRSKKHCPKAEF